MAKVEIVAERCKSCGYCVKFCPKHVLEIGTKVNSKGYEYVTPARPEDCIGCGHCDSRCPFHVEQVKRMEEIREYFGK